jgi:hypothetical protein
MIKINRAVHLYMYRTLRRTPIRASCKKSLFMQVGEFVTTNSVADFFAPRLYMYRLYSPEEGSRGVHIEGTLTARQERGTK